MKKHGFTLAEVLITLGIIGVVAALTAPSLINNVGSAKIGPSLAKAVSTFEIANETLLTNLGIERITAAGVSTIYQRVMNVPGGSMGTWTFDASTYAEALTNYMKMHRLTNIDDDYTITNYDGSAYNSGPQLGNSLSNQSTPSSPMTPANSARNGLKYLSNDGILYIIRINALGDSGGRAHNQFIGYVHIDINGPSSPNSLGKDVFAFALYNDGTLRPVGSSGWSAAEEQSPEASRGGQIQLDPINTAYNWKTGTTDQCNGTTITTGLTCAGSVFENDRKVIYQ